MFRIPSLWSNPPPQPSVPPPPPRQRFCIWAADPALTTHRILNRVTTKTLKDSTVDDLLDRLLHTLIAKLGPRAIDAYIGLEARDPRVAKAERDANKGKAMERFLDVEKVFTHLAEYAEVRYPRYADHDQALLASNPLCSYKPEAHQECRTDELDESGSTHDIIIREQLVDDSLLSILPAVRAALQFLRAAWIRDGTAVPRTTTSDIFEFLDGLNGAEEAFRAYRYFDKYDSLTIQEFIDQLALSQIIWSIAQLFGRRAIDALERLQEQQGKYLLRWSPVHICGGNPEFDWTDSDDPLVRKIRDGFISAINYDIV